jgi:hypothetical protein
MEDDVDAMYTQRLKGNPIRCSMGSAPFLPASTAEKGCAARTEDPYSSRYVQR